MMSVPSNPLGAGATAIPAGRVVAPRSGPAGATGAGGITPSDIWRIIRRRVWVIVITAAICMVVGVGINIAWRMWWPKWVGVAILQVESPLIPEALAQRQLAGAPLLEMFAKAEANRIRSRQYARDVLKKDKVRKTAWFKKHEKTALRDFEKGLSVHPIRESPQIMVSFHTRNRGDAPRIVNALVDDVYLPARQSQAEQQLDARWDSLRKQRGELETNLTNKNNRIQRYVEDEKIAVIIGQQTEVETELRDKATMYSQIEMVLVSAKFGLDAMRLQNPAIWTPDAMSQRRMDTDPIIQSLRQYLLNLNEEREAQSKRLGPDHLHMKRFDERIRIVGRDLEVKVAELKHQLFVENLSGLEQAVSSNEETLKQIQDGIEAIRKKQDQRNPKILIYQNMQESKAGLVRSLETVKAMITGVKAQLEEASRTGTQVVLVSPAIEAPEPSSPKLIMNLVATFFLSIMAGGGLAFLLEFMDKSVRSSQDIRRHTDLSLLGTIPALEEDEANPEDMYSVVTHAPRSLLAEAFRQIRTNIMFSCRMKKCRSMLITSPGPDDGRTCIAVNLAASIALSGQKVLLIDANFRKPALKRLFPNLPDLGFAELLSGSASIEQAIVQSDTPGLWVMGNGQAPVHHSQLLGGSTLSAVIEKLSNQFDQVILDGPPALLSADALTLSGQVAGIVFVARAGKTSRGELNRTREEISRLNSHIHGVVLNAIEAIGGGYLRERYRLFYDYDESLAQVAAETEPQSQEEESDPKQPEQS